MPKSPVPTLASAPASFSGGIPLPWYWTTTSRPSGQVLNLTNAVGLRMSMDVGQALLNDSKDADFDILAVAADLASKHLASP